MSAPLKVLGIDPGSRCTGYGIVQVQGTAVSYVASGCIRLDPAAELWRRLQAIFSGVGTVIERYRPQVMAVEQAFLSNNVQSTVKLSEARAAAMVAASSCGLEISEYSARQIKQAVVGYGAAHKEQVQYMIRHILQVSGRLQADAADALACAICHAYTAHMTAAVSTAALATSVRGRYRERRRAEH